MRYELLLRPAICLTLVSAPLLADFSYDQTTQITGGALLGMMRFASAFSKNGKKMTEPIQSTTSLKGNRLVRKTADEATVIDLDHETITTIHFADKTYSVLTFEQIKQQMEQASAKMRARQGDQGNMSFDVSVKDTGQKKTIDGHDTHEAIMTLTMSGSDAKSGSQGAMNVVSDSWIAPGVEGYDEYRDFHKRMAEKLGWMPGESPLLNRPDMAKSMAELYKQGSKLDGIPLVSTVKMGATVQGAPDSTSAGASSSNSSATSNSHSADSPSAALASALGSRFGFGHKKKQTEAAGEDQSSTNQNASSDGSLIEMTSQIHRFDAKPVDASLFEVPAGFTKITEDIVTHKRQ